MIDYSVRVKVMLCRNNNANIHLPARLSVFPGTYFGGLYFPVLV